MENECPYGGAHDFKYVEPCETHDLTGDNHWRVYPGYRVCQKCDLEEVFLTNNEKSNDTEP